MNTEASEAYRIMQGHLGEYRGMQEIPGNSGEYRGIQGNKREYRGIQDNNKGNTIEFIKIRSTLYI